MEPATLAARTTLLRRPRSDEWDRILEILETANFHRIGGPEMPDFPLGNCFVAEKDGLVVGVAGYRILDRTTAKTTLLAVHPDHRCGGDIGTRLQRARMDFLKGQGIRLLRTNVDDPRVLRWYQRRFGYESTGQTVPKVEPFGRPEIQFWTTLEVAL